MTPGGVQGAGVESCPLARSRVEQPHALSEPMRFPNAKMISTLSRRSAWRPGRLESGRLAASHMVAETAALLVSRRRSGLRNRSVYADIPRPRLPAKLGLLHGTR